MLSQWHDISHFLLAAPTFLHQISYAINPHYQRKLVSSAVALFFILLVLLIFIPIAYFTLIFLASWKCQDFKKEVWKEYNPIQNKARSWRLETFALVEKPLIDQQSSKSIVFFTPLGPRLRSQFWSDLHSYFLHSKSAETSNKKKCRKEKKHHCCWAAKPS